MDTLRHLATLLAKRNALDAEIAAIIGRPALPGHLGEYLASTIFDIALHPSATHRGSDGYFTSGPLAGRTVNVKWYGKQEGLLDLNPAALPDYYLVLTGPRMATTTSRGTGRPAVISAIYLFNAESLLADLRPRSVKLGVATSVRRSLWDNAELYPSQRNPMLPLTQLQREQLALFAAPPQTPLPDPIP